MTWTFTIAGPEGQAGSVAMNEADEATMIEGATKLIRDALAQPKPEPSKGETQERKKARG